MGHHGGLNRYLGQRSLHLLLGRLTPTFNTTSAWRGGTVVDWCDSFTYAMQTRVYTTHHILGYGSPW